MGVPKKCERCLNDEVTHKIVHDDGTTTYICPECEESLRGLDLHIITLGVPDEDTYRGGER